jgi:SOS-response transcriptional repressor LexA
MTRLGLKILKYIKTYVRENEIPPTRKEIKLAISYAVKRLEEDQLIKRIPGRARNIWPV